jgi:O-antigen/teichoic acid export membrane protein
MSKSEAKDHYWIKSGFFSFLQNFSSVIFGFGSFYILVRILPTKNDFGTWALFMTTTAILENVRNGLIQNALVRYLSLSPAEEHQKIVSASFANSGLLSGICILLNLVLAHYLSVTWHAPVLEKMFYLYSFVYLISGILTQLQFIEQAYLKFNGIFLTTFIRQGIFFIYVFCCLVFNINISLIHLVYVQIFSVTASMIVSWFFVKKYFHFQFSLERGWMKTLFNYGKYAFGTSISSTVFSSIDQMMLGSYLSAAAAGTYNIAVRVTNLVEIPTNAIAAIVFPQSAKRVGDQGLSAVKYLYEKSVGTLLAILLPGLLFLLFFSRLSIHFIAGDKYADAIPILKVTVFYCLFVPYGRQFGVLLDSMGKARLTFIIVFICAVINIGLNYVLIHKFDVLGAAYATLSANIIGFLISQAILKKQLKVNFFNTFKYALKFYPELYQKIKLFLIKK